MGSAESIKLICLPYIVIPCLLFAHALLSSTLGRLVRVSWSLMSCKVFRCGIKHCVFATRKPLLKHQKYMLIWQENAPCLSVRENNHCRIVSTTDHHLVADSRVFFVCACIDPGTGTSNAVHTQYFQVICHGCGLEGGNLVVASHQLPPLHEPTAEWTRRVAIIDAVQERKKGSAWTACILVASPRQAAYAR